MISIFANDAKQFRASAPPAAHMLLEDIQVRAHINLLIWDLIAFRENDKSSIFNVWIKLWRKTHFHCWNFNIKFTLFLLSNRITILSEVNV